LPLFHKHSPAKLLPSADGGERVHLKKQLVPADIGDDKGSRQIHQSKLAGEPFTNAQILGLLLIHGRGAYVFQCRPFFADQGFNDFRSLADPGGGVPRIKAASKTFSAVAIAERISPSILAVRWS